MRANVEEAALAGEVEGAPAEPAEMEIAESAMEAINGTAAQEDSGAGDDLEETCKLVKEICELSEAGLNDVSDSSEISEISGTEGADTEEQRDSISWDICANVCANVCTNICE